MSLILNIDTALETASVCIAKDKDILLMSSNDEQKDHATWLHAAIAELLAKTGYSIKDLNAIAVSIGPGSYTGLRVGLAAAKGFCYARNIPLLTVNTLKQIAFAAKDEAAELICPLIDARRMEVFTALYNTGMEEKKPAHAMIIDENSFAGLLLSSKILFCGNGTKKLQAVLSHKNAAFSSTAANASHLAELALPLFQKGLFADIAYTEPFYLKEFYTASVKNPK